MKETLLIGVCTVKVGVEFLAALFAISAIADNYEWFAAVRRQLINKIIAPCIFRQRCCFEIAACVPARNIGGLFDEFQVMTVDPAEPFAANVVRVGRALLTAAAFPRTRRIMEERGLEVHVVDVSELAKAEGAVTCCSILLEA